MYINVNSKNFEEEVIKSKLPVLVDFWAEWCGPCRALLPTIDEIAKEKQGKLKVCKVNIENSGDLATKYEVMSVPTIMIFKEGKPMEKKVGLIPKKELEKVINKYI